VHGEREKDANDASVILGYVEEKRREEEIGVSTERGGDDVVAGGRLGMSWHAWERAARRENWAGIGEDDAWKEEKQEVERRRWQSGDQGESSALAEEGEQSRAHACGRRSEGGGPEDQFVKTKIFRDPTEKKHFPLI
jgi:hypothetical protein